MSNRMVIRDIRDGSVYFTKRQDERDAYRDLQDAGVIDAVTSPDVQVLNNAWSYDGDKRDARANLWECAGDVSEALVDVLFDDAQRDWDQSTTGHCVYWIPDLIEAIEKVSAREAYL